MSAHILAGQMKKGRQEADMLRGCDFSGSRWADCYFHRCAFLLISDEKKELAGAVVDLYQAAELAGLTGLVIR